jgi:localization factor PodJL
MNSGLPWQVSGVRAQARQSAREAARRAGMSVGEWLDNVILDSAPPNQAAGNPTPEPPKRGPGEEQAAIHQEMTELRHRLDVLSQRLTEVVTATAGSAERPRVAGQSASALDQALLEIADRQRTLDGSRTAPPASPSPQPWASSEALPRPCTQDFSGLEEQLRQINAQVANFQVANLQAANFRPCGIDRAVEVLREELTQIAAMLCDAVPGKSVQTIEAAIHNLTERIEGTRTAGADAAALESVERGLGEVRDALRDLTLSDHRAGLDRELQELSRKIEELAQGHHDPVALGQLENAIISLRSIVPRGVSNDALTTLSVEVRALAEKIDRAAAEWQNENVLDLLEERIATLADALAARNGRGNGVPHELETALKTLVDKIEQMQLTPGDHIAVAHLEDRIAGLIEKLDSSDARLNHLEAIERGLAELLVHLEHHRTVNAQMTSPPAELDALALNVADLKQTGRKTHEAIERVHGTLDHVVDRLATLETNMQSKAAPATDESLLDVKPFSREASVPARSPGAAREPELGMADARSAAPSPFSAIQSTEVGADASQKRERAMAAERRAIDPTLPPDHPLEPGISTTRRLQLGSPADRIAASESALLDSQRTVAPERRTAADFIAAARRAAQAAGRTPPSQGTASGTREIASAAGKLAKRVGKLRALIAGTSATVILLGALQISTLLRGFPEADPSSQQTAPASTAATEPAASNARAAPRKGAAASPEQPVARNWIARDVPPNEPADSQPRTADPWIFSQSTISESGSTAAQRDKNGSAAGHDESTGSIFASPPLSKVGSERTPLAGAPTSPSLFTGVPTPSAAVPAAMDPLPPAFGSRLRAAAARGDAAAEYEIASRYAEGRGVTQSLADAVTWYERAAKHGLAPAQFRLGGLYEKGLGVKKDLDLARRYYLAAGDAGNAKALHNLAVLYAEGIDGKPDYQTAAKWFRKAADFGIGDSQYNLAILYARGIGVEQNLAESYKWFSLAAREGDADAASKRDEIASRLDPRSLGLAAQAVQAWTARKQADAAVEVKAPAGGWEEVASSPITAPTAVPSTVPSALPSALPNTSGRQKPF